MKLESKHLAPYLPYRLKLLKIEQSPFKNKEDIVSIEEWGINDIKSVFDKRFRVRSIKPILRPLSDLTKKELYDAGFDYQADWLTNELEDNIKRYGSLENVIKKTDFGHVQYLLSKHYDILGLIEQGLAIDINTLNK